MLTPLQGLEEALPGLVALRSAVDRQIDWQVIHGELGVQLPSDFRELGNAYSSWCASDFLMVALPRVRQEQRFARGVLNRLGVLEDLVEDDMAAGYVSYPAKGGLLPCAETSSGDIFYWQTSQVSADEWPVVVSTRNDDWWEYRGGIVSLLGGLFSGQVNPLGLPTPFPGSDSPVVLIGAA